jgi:hypothetical protein
MIEVDSPEEREAAAGQPVTADGDSDDEIYVTMGQAVAELVPG